MLSAIEALHSAARRYCADRADEWRRAYAPIAQRDERSAKSGLLKKLGLTVARESREALKVYPRYIVLDAILVEIQRSVPDDFTGLDGLRRWLVDTARAAFEEEARPPDLVLSRDDEMSFETLMTRIQSAGLGKKAKIVGRGRSEGDRKLEMKVMKEELDAFVGFVSSCTPSTLAGVEPLPYRRSLSDEEGERFWTALEARWHVHDDWLPGDASGKAPKSITFQAEPFFDERLVTALQQVVAGMGADRLIELREFKNSANYEIDLALLKPWYTGEEGYWFEPTLDWVIFASHEGSVSLAGAQLVERVKSAWRNWHEYLFTGIEYRVQRRIGPDLTTVTIPVEPPPGSTPEE